MMLYPMLYMALSLLGTVLSGPMLFDDFATEQQSEMQDYVDVQRHPPPPPPPPYVNTEYYDAYQSDTQSYVDMQGQPPPPPPPPYVNTEYYDAYQSDTQSYVDMQGAGLREGESKLPAEELKELKERMRPREMEVQEMEELAEAELRHTVTARNVMHGSIVAIKYDKTSFLSCPTKGAGFCSTSKCPGMFLDTNEWLKCRENVFQIFHSSKLGPIRVGDFVAFYFPADRKWFSMYQNKGHKQIQCPGYPNKIYGFHREDSWFHCGAEVFRIYAAGKLNGQIIEDQDLITVYVPSGGQYLKLGAGTPILNRCPGKHPPSNPFTYDRCVGEVFKIRLR